MDAILETLGPKKLALLSKRIFNRIAANAPHSSDDQSSPLFSDGERAKLVSSFGVSSLGEVDSLVNEVEQFWKDLRIHGGENTADRIRSMELGDATRSTILQIWNELGKTILSQNQAETRPSAVVPGKVSDLLDVDYSVGVIVARKENDDSLPKPVMQMELSTSTGPMNVELDFEQLAALHAALRDAQAHFDSS